ncbi:MAG TPA: bifunctional 4-hydroxy-2-oxoglutarate aldolase/2-dehydro-3-deoxy-phosphogluconate aldolase [Anaerolineae bacterium]|nr:MAG: 2-dehydro-3-deoxyphosphogluconate aldolase [Anaerolineae bacterium SM23_ 63]HEY42422.1 bifunctional 4-hydroxy-2-oxoglutarate aldolase/2-dehydro-3-deoxy-phosphogluconate aldolase [Anaerolineae bacterium]
MNKEDTLTRIREIGLLSVIRGPSPELTLKMVDALVAGGVYGIEITYTTPNAPEVVKALDEKFGNQILLGMGTLTKPEHAVTAKEAGALFIVSPHCSEELAKAMVETGLAVMIGALTPSEVVQAREWGADVVKVFPGSLVGPGYLKALRGPFPDIPVMPTGGVSIENVADWFAAGAYAVGAGSDLCPSAWAKEGRFDEITERAKTFVKEVEKARSG